MIPALSDAHDSDELEFALDGLKSQVESGEGAIDKSALVMVRFVKG